MALAIKKCPYCGEDITPDANKCILCGEYLYNNNIEQDQEINSTSSSGPIFKTKRSKLKILNKILLSILLVIFFFFIGLSIIKQVFSPTSQTESLLTQIASETNKSLPMMVDSETRLDNSAALPNKVFQYNYTLVNTIKGTANTQISMKTLRPTIINYLKTSPDMKWFRDNDITFIYSYKDKYGQYMFETQILASQYKY